jgi:His-Xaa-Ser system protein HxsD
METQSPEASFSQARQAADFGSYDGVAGRRINQLHDRTAQHRATCPGWVHMESVEITFVTSSHSADAIQRAAYRYCDRFSLELRSGEEQHVCVLTFLAGIATEPAVLADFRTEVLDQVLRERIRKETEPVRNLILALAFSNAALG